MTQSKDKTLPQSPKKFLGIEMTMEFNFRRFRKGLYVVLSALTFLASIAIVIQSSTWSPFDLVINHIAFMLIFAATIFELMFKDLVIVDLKEQLADK